MKTIYQCQGSVRGSCGHNHRGVGPAMDCCEKDQKGCKSQGGYSDRYVMQSVDGGKTWELYSDDYQGRLHPEEY